jgi:hypothetical protein
VTVQGTGFLAGATVSIGGVNATSVVRVSDSTLTAVTGAHAAGVETVVVTNTDTQTGTLANAFRYLGSIASFADDPTAPRATTVRAAHLIELRHYVDELRLRAALGRFAWTDPTLVPGVTTIKTAHLAELRSSLTAVYAAVGREAPSFNAAAAPGSVITAASIAELRAAVRAIW